MNISQLELKMLAKEASEKYLNDKVPLNTTIQKVASDKGLNPHQLARVCEEANLSTYNAMWSKVGSGDFVFDLADQEKIASAIDSKSTMIPDEYSPISSLKDLLPEDTKVESKSDKGVKEAAAGIMKIASKVEEAPKVSINSVRKTAARLDYFISELDSAIFEAQVMKKEAEINLRDTLKVAALNGENIVKVYAAALAAFPDKTASIRELFEKMSTELGKWHISMQKHAKSFNEDATGAKAENNMVINKSHPVLKTIDTIVNADDQICKAEKAKPYLVKKVEILKKTLIDKKFDNSDE